MASALSVEVLKERQDRVETEIADAKRLISNAQTASDEVNARLQQVISLLKHAERLYMAAGDEARAILNHAVFDPFEIDSVPDDGTSVPTISRAPLTPVVGAVGGISPVLEARDERTPAGLSLGGGSNVTNLAVAVGFEPTVGVNPHTLSRRAP
jgi:hypothetical protein